LGKRSSFCRRGRDVVSSDKVGRWGLLKALNREKRKAITAYQFEWTGREKMVGGGWASSPKVQKKIFGRTKCF